VLCEKPLTRRPEDAEAAFDAAERAGRVLAEGFMWRHHPQAAHLRELLGEGAVGELRLVRAAFSFDIFGEDRPDDVRLQAGLDGGGLMDVGCYCVSAMRLLAGEPQAVSGRRIDGGDGIDVRFTGTLAFAGGVLGSFDCGLDMVARSALEVVGDAGSLLLSDPWHSRAPRIELRRSGGTETVEPAVADPYACELEDFAAAVRGERPHPFGRADAVGQARAIAALYRAAESGADEAP
jgi:D-xylose 1-dehydrogenase (NADP+, D-xylono-1,5-lactone-forming)